MRKYCTMTLVEAAGNMTHPGGDTQGSDATPDSTKSMLQTAQSTLSSKNQAALHAMQRHSAWHSYHQLLA